MSLGLNQPNRFSGYSNLVGMPISEGNSH